MIAVAEKDIGCRNRSTGGHLIDIGYGGLWTLDTLSLALVIDVDLALVLLVTCAGQVKDELEGMWG